MAWISTFAITNISTDGSLATFQWIRFVILFGFRARWQKKSCQVHGYLLDYNTFGITEFFHCWYPILEYSYVALSFTFCIDILPCPSLLHLFVVCFRVCLVCLRVTMTSSTQGKLTGYLPRTLIWIGQSFVYHTCKKVRITYKYLIRHYYYMGCDMARTKWRL
jgi:hypothetical protein